MTRPWWPARRQEQHSDQRPTTHLLRPQPALATCDAMRARDPSLRPDLQPAPATIVKNVVLGHCEFVCRSLAKTNRRCDCQEWRSGTFRFFRS